MVPVARDQSVPDTDLKDAQHGEDVDLRRRIRLMDAEIVEHQLVQQQHDQPKQDHARQPQGLFPGAAPGFPQQQDQSRDPGDDHPGIQAVEGCAVGIRPARHVELRKVDPGPVHPLMKVVGQRGHSQCSAGDQQQRFVPSAPVRVAVPDPDAGHEEQRRDQHLRSPVGIGGIAGNRHVPLVISHDPVLEHPHRQERKHQEPCRGHVPPDPGRQEPDPHGPDPEQDQPGVNGKDRAEDKGVQGQVLRGVKKMEESGQQQETGEDPGVPFCRPLLHGRRPFHCFRVSCPCDT